MRNFILLLLAFFSAWNSRCVAQQPGDLDNSFGIGGKVESQIPWKDIAVQQDGKLLAVGSFVARYNTDGTLDTSFAHHGRDTFKAVGGQFASASAVAIQPDGKILVLGSATSGTLKDFVLVRYHANGTRDTSFDGDGVLETDFNSGSDDYGYELAIQPDGKILAAGASNQKLALARYLSNGAPDSTFDQDGKLILNNINVDFNNNWSHATFMQLQADGKILAGSAYTLTRLNPNGNTDNTFGVSGLKMFQYPLNDLVLQPDAKIVLAGGNWKDFVLTRIDSNGYADNSFGMNGTTIVTAKYPNCSNNTHKATSLELQPDGRILVAGFKRCCALGDCREFVLMRYNPNGFLDSSFNTDGRLTTRFSFSAESHASVLTPDNKLVLAGFSYDIDRGAMAKYHLGPLLEVGNVNAINEKVTVAPNPAHDLISIKAANLENGVWHLEITDLTGKLLIHDRIAVVNGSLNQQISMQPLADGVYFLKLSNSGQQSIHRIVKGK